MHELIDAVSRWGLDLRAVPLEATATRLLAALLIGVPIAVRPWRYLLGRRPPRAEMAQAQVLLCAAAAIITMVIGDSLAKAFGLVGLGSFVRFRSGLKDPRDAAVLFLLIGLGMACGHGSLGLALTGGVFAALLLAVLDLFRVPDIAPGADAPQGEAREEPVPGAAAASGRAAPGGHATDLR